MCEGSFDAFIWRFAGGRPRHNRWRSPQRIHASTAQSEVMNKALRVRGFRFTGSTICHACMQATGLVNNHVTGCFRHQQIRGMQP